MKTADKLHDDPLCTEELLRYLIITAYEGGSNYWYTELDHELPAGKKYKDYATKEEDIPRYNIPLVEGCATLFTTHDDLEEAGLENERTLTKAQREKAKLKTYTLDRKALLKGWDLMREKYRHIYANVIQEDYDAGDADVFLQLCLFGELVYG